jgi:hypothetical protein
VKLTTRHRLASLVIFLLLRGTENVVAQTQIDAAPGMIALCDDAEGCTYVTLQSAQGVAQWGNHNNSTLTIERLDDSAVNIRREDLSGPSKGLTGRYTGTRTGSWLEGPFTFTPPGQTVPITIRWHAILLPPMETIKEPYLNSIDSATAWQVCMDLGGACDTNSHNPPALWILADKRGHSQFPTQPVATNALFIDHMDQNTIVIRGFDLYGFFAGLTGLYTGTRQGNTMRGTVRWIWPGHPELPPAANWVATTLPKNCNKAASGPGMDAKDVRMIASITSMLGDSTGYVQCNTILADHGDSAAEFELGHLYYAGSPSVKTDYDVAAHWFLRSCSHNNLGALKALFMMYQKHQGKTVDLLSAKYLYGLAHLRSGGQGSTQAPANLSSALQDMMSNMAQGVGDDGELETRVHHEKAVLDDMHAGMSRVQAEEAVFHEEKKRIDENELANPTRCSLNTSSYGGSVPQQRAAEDAAQRELHDCEESKAEPYQRRLDYLQCVHTFVDSNAIEANCTYLR